MSSSIAADTATPRMASSVRVRMAAERGDGEREASRRQRPNSASGAARDQPRRRGQRRAPIPSTSESPTANVTTSGVTSAKTSGVRYTPW